MNPITQRLRIAKRVAEIVAALVRHGLADVASTLNLERLSGTPVPAHPPRPGAAVPVSRAASMRKVFEELGPTFVKLGQVLSTRPDLVPPDWIEELKQLQAHCPEIEFPQIRAVLELEFPGKVDLIFRSIDPVPLSAASMAQAHRVVLCDGKPAVIKVLRPGIEELTRTDMEVMMIVARFIERHFSDLGYNPIDVVNEFSRELKREVDLMHEGRSTDRLRHLFLNDPGVKFPEVYWEATSRCVLTMEEMIGLHLSDPWEGKVDQSQRRTFVANGVRAVLKQCLDFGFFHADPHPGNLFLLPGGRIGFIDCGMTGQLDETTAERLADLIAGVLDGDSSRVAVVLVALADADPEKATEHVFAAQIRELVSRFDHADFSKLNLAQLLSDMFDLLRAEHMRCPGDLVLLLKAVTTIESVGHSLDPTFELADFAQPYVERLVRRRYGAAAIARRIKNSAAAYLDLAERLPTEASAILTKLRHNRLSFQIEHKELRSVTDSIERSAWIIGYGLVLAALYVCAGLLMVANRDPGPLGMSVLGVTTFLAAAILSVRILLRSRKRPPGSR